MEISDIIDDQYYLKQAQFPRGIEPVSWVKQLYAFLFLHDVPDWNGCQIWGKR